MPRLVFTIVWLVALFIGTGTVSPLQAEQPNIIFILADDLGYGDLGCYGQQKIKTPRLDQMAKEGMRFTQFYAGSTVCAPSRCVLMTGLHTGHTRVRGNGGKGLQDEDLTISEVLKQAGYTTALIGKWGLGEAGQPGHPNRQGFDHFYGYLHQGHAHNYYPEFLWRNHERVPLRNVVHRNNSSRFGSGWATKCVDYSHDLIMAEATHWIEQHHQEPFFLYLALTIPHANNERKRAHGDGQEVPDYGIYESESWTNPNKGQAAMVTRMDRQIGQLIDQLVTLGIDKKTLVIFSSDNGHHREGGNDPEFFDANGPLRGKKRDLYEGGIRVPTIAYWPGTIKPGTVSDHVGYFGDFFATACEIGQVEVPSHLGSDSISFLPTLQGRRDQQKHHSHLYWEFYEQGGKQAVRFGKWKAVRMPMHRGPIQLFDVSTDLAESDDLADTRPQIVQKAIELMDKSHTPSPDWKPRGRSRR